MANTIPDVSVPANDWVDVYSATSIAVGTGLIITNKSSYPVLLQIKGTKPSLSSTDGEPLDPDGAYKRLQISPNESGLWAKTLDSTDTAYISVQES